MKSKGTEMTMEVIDSIIQKSVRRGTATVFKDMTIHVASLAAVEKTKSGYGRAVWKNIFEIAAEDLGGALSFSNVKRLNYLYDIWNRNVGNKSVKQAALEKSCRFNMLIAINYLCLLPKSRMAATSSVYSLSRISLDDVPKFPQDFNEKILAPLDSEWKYDVREWNTACQMTVGILTKDYKRALHHFTLLWEWCPESSTTKRCTTDSLRNTRNLIWEVLARCLPETSIYHEAFRTLSKMTGIAPRLWPIAALIRACKFQQTVCDREEKKEEQIYTKAKCIAIKQEEVLFSENIEIPMRDEYYDKHTLKGKNMGRGYKHFFEEAGIVSNELFSDPFLDVAKKIYLREEQQYGRRSKTRDMRIRMRKQFEQDDFEDSNKDGKRMLFLSDNMVHFKKIKPEDTECDTDVYINECDTETGQDVTEVIQDPSVIKESSIMINPIRAQILTSENSKCPTYYATYNDSKTNSTISIFVKGPFKNENSLISHFVSDQFKAELDSPWLNSVDMKLKCMVPDIYVKSDSEYFFLIAQDLCDYRRCKTMIKTSRTIAKDGQVVLDKNSSLCKPLSLSLLENSSEDVAIQFLCVLVYRYGMEINDTCEANIMVSTSDNKVYSVDEASIFGGKRPSLFKKKASFAMKNFIVNKLDKRWNALVSICAEWCNADNIKSISSYQYQTFCKNISECLSSKVHFMTLI